MQRDAHREDVLTVLDTDGPLDEAALIARLGPDADAARVNRMLHDLIHTGRVVVLHLQTLPPRTLYRVAHEATPPDV